MRIAPLLAFVLLVSACRPAPPAATPLPPSPLPPVTLRAYASPTPAASPSPSAHRATPLPSPTPTPFLYTVVADDTLLGIAARYGLSLEELLSANPGTDPNFLSIGLTLTIPLAPEEDAPAPQAVLLPLELSPPQCFPLPDGASWCALEVSNPHEQPVSAVSLAWTISPEDEPLLTALPFDILPPHTALPIGVTLPSGASLPQVALHSALPWQGDEALWPRRAAPEAVKPPLPSTWSLLEGLIPPPEGDETPQTGVVLAAGYDAQGGIVALRQAVLPLDGRSPTAWKLTLASPGSPMVEIRLWIGYRPDATAAP